MISSNETASLLPAMLTSAGAVIVKTGGYRGAGREVASTAKRRNVEGFEVRVAQGMKEPGKSESCGCFNIKTTLARTIIQNRNILYITDLSY